MPGGAARAAGRASDVAQDAASSSTMRGLARAGLAARGVVYVLIGLLALLVARGSDVQADQQGALAQVLAEPFGGWIVAALALGFLGYALWRFSEAAFGVTGERPGPGPRLQSLGRGISYTFLTVTAVSLGLGARGAQSAEQQGYAAELMAHPGGRWVVGAVGVGVAAAGVVMVREGLTLAFLRFFTLSERSVTTRRLVRELGRVGTVGRGFVVVLIGVLVTAAAVTYDVEKAGGLDGALKTLRDGPFGELVLGVTALGLVAFGLFGLCEARFRRV